MALFLCGRATPAVRAEPPQPEPRTEVAFDGPDAYTDWKLSDSADWYRASVFAALRRFLASQAGPLLPAGDHLKITFTDMDLGHRASRLVPASLGAPAFELTYRVTDASGAGVRQGTANRRYHVDFGNYRYSVETTDPATEIIQREKTLLKSWTVSALAGLEPR